MGMTTLPYDHNMAMDAPHIFYEAPSTFITATSPLPPFMVGTTPSFPSNIASQGFVNPLSFVPKSLELPLETQAIAFFFNNFTNLRQRDRSIQGYLELLEPFYKKAMPRSAVHLGINAVALACVGNYPGRSKEYSEAMKYYSEALLQHMRAVTDPTTNKSDETVLATLVFALYEVSHTDR